MGTLYLDRLLPTSTWKRKDMKRYWLLLRLRFAEQRIRLFEWFTVLSYCDADHVKQLLTRLDEDEEKPIVSS